MSASPRRLGLRAAQVAELRERARAALPREACGVLLGRRRGHVLRVREVRPVANLGGAADAFRLHPAELCAALREADARGLAVLGVWHSHPSRDARPSARDLGGLPEGWCGLVVAAGAPDLAAWWSAAGGGHALDWKVAGGL